MALPQYGILAAEARVACGLESDDDTDDTNVEYKLLAAYQAIQAYTGRDFYISGDTSRKFRANAVDGLYLWLDKDLCSLTSVANGDGSDTAVDTGSLVLIPENDGPPYDCIWWPNGAGWQIAGDTEYITVTGKWGYSETLPAIIRGALLDLTGHYYNLKDSSATEVVRLPNGSEVIVRRGMPRDVVDKIKSYMIVFR